jgi:hypothetical protein
METRKTLSNPFANVPLYDRLTEKQAVDLRNNKIVVDRGNGYNEFIPIDRKKTFRR